MITEYDIYKRNRLTLHCVFTLKSPLSHIGEVSGNVSNLKTIKLLDLENTPRSCFVYSGNALRNGILRRVGTASALSDLGLFVNPDTHHTMFAGGRIDGSTACDMELDKKIRQLLPWLSVLGAAKPVNVFGTASSQMIAGRIAVGSAYLMCYESCLYIYNNLPGILPFGISSAISQLLDSYPRDPFKAPTEQELRLVVERREKLIPIIKKVLKSWTEFVTIDQVIRKDSLHEPNIRRFLSSADNNSSGQLSLLPQDKPEKESKKSDQMISSDRLIMPGSKLYSRWDLHCTDVEEGWVYNTLLKFSEAPYLGGKSNRGNGLVSLDVYYTCPDNDQSGLLCSLNSPTGDTAVRQCLSSRFQEQVSRYNDYIAKYKTFLQSAKESSSIKSFLNV